jgi:parallel beta-helix repeat protein
MLLSFLAAVSIRPAMADPSPVTCGSVITAPGDYFLAGDCGGAGITILASQVHLKLMGHSLYGCNGFCGDFLHGLVASNVSKLHIEGPGTITAYIGDGISFSGVSDSHVDQVRSVNNSGSGFLIVDSTNIHVNNGVFSMNNYMGVVIRDDSNNVHVDKNETNFNGYPGILVLSTDNYINGNSAHSNRFFDLDDENQNCDQNKWNHNSFYSANQPCIH